MDRLKVNIQAEHGPSKTKTRFSDGEEKRVTFKREFDMHGSEEGS